MRKARKPLTSEQQQLALNNLRLVDWYINRMLPTHTFIWKMLTEDEARSAIYLGLVDAVGYFDPARGKLSSLFSRCAYHRLCVDANNRILMRPFVGVKKSNRQIPWKKFVSYSRTWIGEENPHEPYEEDPKGLENQEAFHTNRKRITYCLNQLNERHRQILYDRYWRNKTFREMAQECGRTHQAIADVECTALRNFRACWLEEGGDDWI